MRLPSGTPRTSSLLVTLCIANALSEERGLRQVIETPPENSWVTPSIRRQSTLDSLHMNIAPDTRRWASGLVRSGQIFRIPSRIRFHEGSSPLTSPTRQSNSPVPGRFGLCALRRGQEAWRCPGWRQRRHAIGSRHSRAACPRPRHLKHRPSLTGSTGRYGFCGFCIPPVTLSLSPLSWLCRTTWAYVFPPTALKRLLDGRDCWCGFFCSGEERSCGWARWRGLDQL